MAFEQILSNAGSLPVRVRLLDLASDKRPDWYRGPSTTRTALGLHGSRLYDTQPVRQVVEAQLTALAGIPCTERLSLLLPGITQPAEFDRLVNQLAPWLPQSIPVGAMAETPAAVLALSELLERAPFAAVGCNDLM
jgi:phosphoenolpyruvate-protein kinase (PTS system EI component)